MLCYRVVGKERIKYKRFTFREAQEAIKIQGRQAGNYCIEASPLSHSWTSLQVPNQVFGPLEIIIVNGGGSRTSNNIG
jgi:hypothetical protein